jgi:hypothetical protein
VKPHSQFIADQALLLKKGRLRLIRDFKRFPATSITDWLPTTFGSTLDESRWATLDAWHRTAITSTHLEPVALHHLSNVKIIFSDNHECMSCGGPFSAHGLVANSGHVMLMNWSSSYTNNALPPARTQESFTVRGSGKHMVLIPLQIRHMSKGLLDIWKEAVASAPAHLHAPASIRHAQFVSHSEWTWGLACPHCCANVPPIFDSMDLQSAQKVSASSKQRPPLVVVQAGDLQPYQSHGWVVSVLRFSPPPL